MRGLWTLLTALFAVMLVAASAHAQANFSPNNIEAELRADGPPVPGEEWMLALHFEPVSEEWHGYWSNPGDAGLGMQLEWQLPQGWTAGEPLYPVPQRLEIAGLINHIYKGAYTVLIPVSVPEDAAVTNPAPLRVRADYLACTDEICVPESAELSLDPSAAREEPRFAEWRAAIAPLLDSPARYELGTDRLRIAIPLPQALEIGAPHVYLENRDLIDYGAVQTFFRDRDLLIAEIPLGGGIEPDGLRGILSFADESGIGEGVRFTAAPGEVPVGGEPLAMPMRELPSVWLAMLGALAGGLLLNIMPCVFPILSLKALTLAKAGGDERAARTDAMAYTAGVVLACVMLGALLLALRAAGEQIGWAFQLQEPGIVLALLVLAVLITVNFAGGFELPGLTIAGGSGVPGSFATGLLAAFVATPCTGPFMAAAIGAALLLPAMQALGLFAALGIGLALPFLLLGFVPALRRRMPSPGPWMETFRKWMAVPMGLTALALVWLIWRLGGWEYAMIGVGLAAAAVLIAIGLLGRANGKAPRYLALAGAAVAVLLVLVLPDELDPPAAERGASLHEPLAFSPDALAEARASRQPVFIWFTADWCLSCKVNESTAIEREDTKAAFDAAGVITMRGDWTRRDEAITMFLTQQGAAGVPLYLWYPSGGGEPEQLPQVLTPGFLQDLADPDRGKP